jgi:hypothetical protein
VSSLGKERQEEQKQVKHFANIQQGEKDSESVLVRIAIFFFKTFFWFGPFCHSITQ